MIKTRISQMLGIQYPIIQAPMNWISGADLVSAVSAAGGLGTLGPNAGQKTPANDEKEVGERLRSQIKKVRSITDKPFAVNIAIAMGDAKKFSDAFVRVVIEEKVPVAIVSMGAPQVYTKELKDKGVKVFHTVTTVKHGKRAEVEGVDAVIAEGYEGGGHLGNDDHTTMCLVPELADAVKIPVIAGGGIVDSRGFMAALALGAEAAFIGTRFLATRESDAHQNVKDVVIKATGADTIVLGKNLGVSMVRTVKNEFSQKFHEMELGHAPLGDLYNLQENHAMTKPGYLVSRMYPTFCLGDTVQGVVSVNDGVGLIKDVVSAGQVIEEIVKGSSSILRRLEDTGIQRK
ncbi:MAG: nitronate monooxygenase [Dehalococcoidia bacterium]